MNRTKKNISYNMLYQVIILLIPLITAPYLSRTLGKEGIGIYTYTNSIAYYFVLISMLGLTNYGNRLIAQTRDYKVKLSETFSEIYTMQIIISIFSLICFGSLIFIMSEEYRNIYLIQFMYVSSALFDVSWFFYGIEQFKKVLIRNAVLRVIMLIGIFIFVKNENDVWKYTFIMAFGTLISQVYLWFGLKKEVNYRIPNFRKVIFHLKPNIVLFIPVVAVSLYRTMDKVMLGALSTMNETGLYENANKIVTIPLSLIVAIGTVMMPKISNLFVKGEKNKILIYLRDSMQLISALSFAMCFGMAAISERFAPLYFGKEFTECGELILYLSVIMIFVSLASVMRMQYLIPSGKDTSYIISVICGAIINLTINFILIGKYGAMGAVIGTISAEFGVFLIQCIASSKELPLSQYIKDMLPFFVSGACMYWILKKIEVLIPNSLIGIGIEIIVGAIIYSIICVSIMMTVNKNRLKYFCKFIFSN
ncbi:TPA: flippase [Clostridium perfringens]|nr:flippase [Clostridium perfringens]HBI6224297.1 flippase [Clostridium perfringens]HBI7062232.1 flippase [Clostridium perfringens]HBI7065302.1 flippase [Clostridium perfringens]HBI7068316.1 flippase [Clostridium perfringens]